MTMKKLNLLIGSLTLIGVIVGTTHSAKTEEPAPNFSLEVVATPEAIKDVALRGSPIAVWATLEHGEQLECLDCIAYVEPLLWNKDARVREISAWWLRRRVFGYAEVALKVRKVIESDADPERRAAAADALGEFMDPGATKYLVKAASDSSPIVRAHVMSALRRMNDMEGVPAVSLGLADGEVSVRRAALETATKLPGFRDVPAVAKLLSDIDPVVRGRAADALGVFKAKGSAAGLMALAVSDSSEDVRVNAVNALGELADPIARPTIEKALNDASPRVRDAARVASLKIAL
jgi:HEAT repeat protein